jgi:hypothetical protein
MTVEWEIFEKQSYPAPNSRLSTSTVQQMQEVKENKKENKKGVEWNGMEWNGMEWNGMEWEMNMKMEMKMNNKK